MRIRLWSVAAFFLIATYLLSTGSQLNKLINVVDTYIYFIYIQIMVTVLLIALVSFVFTKVSAITMLPKFITDNFITNYAAETLKEKGTDAIEDMDKIKAIKEKFDRFSMSSLFISLLISIASLVSAYMLVNRGGVNVEFNNEIIMLLGANVMFMVYFFYEQIKVKSRTIIYETTNKDI